MFMASLAGLIALPLMLLSVLLPVALVAALQVWLCKRRSRWLGLILPGLTLLASLLILLSMAAFTRVGASEVVYDAHGTVVEEHHAEHWEVPQGRSWRRQGAFSWWPISPPWCWEASGSTIKPAGISGRR